MTFLQSKRPFAEPLMSGFVTVPEEYCFENNIDNFIKDADTSIHFVGHRWSDSRFSNVSHRPEPGKQYKYEILPIVEYISHCNECLRKLKEKKVLLMGAHGLLLFFYQIKAERRSVPLNTQIFSFDEKKGLYHDGHCEQVPYLYYPFHPELRDDPVYGKYKLEVSTINFWSSLPSKGASVLCFYDV